MGERFNNELLLLARQYRGASQAEVAEAAGLNQGHYSRIENGLTPDGPSLENAERIAASLHFPVTYFYLDDSISGLPLSVHAFHRKKASVGQRELGRIHAELNLRIIHLRRYLRAVDVERKFPLPRLDVDEGGGPTEIARLVRRTWLIPAGPFDNLSAACERAGILVVWCDFGAPVDGVTMTLPELPPCIFLNRTAPPDRMRFSLAHELGHVIMHRIPKDGMEDEANLFARELLMPEREFRADLLGQRITMERLAQLKRRWRVAMQAALLRASHLGALKPHQSEYLWKLFSRNGWRTKEPPETEFEYERPSLFPGIVNLYSDKLGYKLADFANLLRFNEVDVSAFYDVHDTPDGTAPKLRIVK